MVYKEMNLHCVKTIRHFALKVMFRKLICFQRILRVLTIRLYLWSKQKKKNVRQ